MLTKLFMMAIAVSIVVGVVLLVLDTRHRQRRRVSRRRRNGDYAARRTRWSDHLRVGRRTERLTDQRAIQD